MNSFCEQPFQYRQLRSQSLSPYNDCNLIKQLKRQLHYPPQKMMPFSSFEYMQNPDSEETNIISADSIQQYCKLIKDRKNSLYIDADPVPVDSNLSVESNPFKQIVPKIIVVKKLEQNVTRKKKKKLQAPNPQDCNDDDTINNTIQLQQIVNQMESKRENVSILPQIKKSKLQQEELPIKRSARYEELMKKNCDDQLVELQSLIKKMQKQPINKKEKKVTFLL